MVNQNLPRPKLPRLINIYYMNFSASTNLPDQIEASALALFVYADKTSAEEKLVDKLLSGQISNLRKLGDLTGDSNQVKIFIHSEKLPRVLVVGLGKVKEVSAERLRAAVSAVVGALKTMPVKKVVMLCPQISKLSTKTLAQEITEAVILSAYEFSEYKRPDEKKKADFENFELVFQNKRDKKEGEAGLNIGQIIARAVTATRDLGNHPSNIATPSHLAEHALRIAREAKNVKVKILHLADIKKERMGGLLAVCKGSDEEPKFIILEYNFNKTAPTVALVGKGITFDSGGISIKPSDKMEEMKYDMAGGATVMGIIKAAADLKLPLNIIGLIPATENLPSGKAIKPGDIIVSRNGKTIEIVNTDAEGRLVLADALDFAKQYKPVLVIDFATLTGSIVVALGDDLIGGFTNNNKRLSQIREAADATGEKIWPMPLVPEYEPFIKSDFADLRNIGTIRYGDSINAANFLKN